MTAKELEVLPYLLFKYAEIDLTTGECIGILTASKAKTEPQYIQIPTLDMNYEGKFYLNGQWYEDAAGTIPWSPEA